MLPRREIRELERLQIALENGPDAKRDWLLSQRQDTAELLAEIDRELAKLSAEGEDLGVPPEQSGACASRTVSPSADSP